MQIIFNGRPHTTTCPSVMAFIRQHYPDQASDLTHVLIVNGFQTTSDMPLNEGDIVHWIPKGTLPPEDVLESMMAARHTPHVHTKVRQAAVAIAGLGGLGSNIAVMLARTGIGRLLLVDFDIVEPSNLNRQSYYISHLGLPKTEALRQQLEQINPYIEISTCAARVTADNAVNIFRGYDVVCEAFDQPAAKAELINTLMEQCPSVKIVAASGMAGYGSANLIQTRRMMDRLYVCGDLVSEAKPGQGLMAPRVQVCAGHQANMILRLLLDIEEA